MTLPPLGAIPDPPGILAMLAKRAPPIARIAPSDLPDSVDLSAGLPPVMYQVGGSCVAWAVGYNQKTHDEFREFGWELSLPEHQFAANYIYNQKLLRTNNLPNTCDRYTAGPDCGMYSSDAYDLLIAQGCCSRANFPTTNQWEPITDDHKERAKPYTASTYGVYNRSNLDLWREMLANGRMLTMLTAWCTNCVVPASPNYIIDTPGTFLGYHQICICGYDTNINGTCISGFKFVNSHGTGYANSGFAWFSENFISTTEYCCAYWMTDSPTPPYNSRVENNVLIWDGSPNITYDIYNSDMAIIDSVTGNSYTPSDHGTYYIGAYGSEPIETVVYDECHVPSCNFGVMQP